MESRLAGIITGADENHVVQVTDIVNMIGVPIRRVTTARTFFDVEECQIISGIGGVQTIINQQCNRSVVSHEGMSIKHQLVLSANLVDID